MINHTSRNHVTYSGDLRDDRNGLLPFAEPLLSRQLLFGLDGEIDRDLLKILKVIIYTPHSANDKPCRR